MTRMELPIDAPIARGLWGLDPEVLYLNHGSFGACPRPVLEYQASLREELEREPVRFLARTLGRRLDDARAELARLLGADPEGLAFVTNATTGVNTVLAAIDLAPGDELLTTDHAYNACRNALEAWGAKRGARVVVARIPFPVTDERQLVEPLLAAVGPRTRLALVDHVTSPTALVFPVREIVSALATHGVDTLVDGAHAPGTIPLALDELGAAYYTGNAHKWLCAPKGAAFLWVRADRREAMTPLVVSHGRNQEWPGRSRFRLEFDWTGTFDPTAWLSIPRALRTLEQAVPGGWPAIMSRQRELALAARARIARRLEVPLPCPDSMIAAMASVLLPPGTRDSPAARLSHDQLIDLAYEHHRIECFFFRRDPAGPLLVRLSAAVYNALGEFERLADLLEDFLGRRR